MRRHHSGDSRDAGAGCCCLSAAAAADDDEAAAAAMLSSSVWYEACTSSLCCKRTHAHTHTNSVIGVSQPPVLDCGTTFHLDSGGRDLPMTLLDNL